MFAATESKPTKNIRADLERLEQSLITGDSKRHRAAYGRLRAIQVSVIALPSLAMYAIVLSIFMFVKGIGSSTELVAALVASFTAMFSVALTMYVFSIDVTTWIVTRLIYPIQMAALTKYVLARIDAVDNGQLGELELTPHYTVDNPFRRRVHGKLAVMGRAAPCDTNPVLACEHLKFGLSAKLDLPGMPMIRHSVTRDENALADRFVLMFTRRFSTHGGDIGLHSLTHRISEPYSVQVGVLAAPSPKVITPAWSKQIVEHLALTALTLTKLIHDAADELDCWTVAVDWNAFYPESGISLDLPYHGVSYRLSMDHDS
jgi:hypothetical protein